MSITVDIDAKIPNNVDLAGDRRLQRALESWQPKFIRWWEELGPVAFKTNPVFLRTAIDVGQQGWANFGHVSMPDYRWGVFLAEPEPDRTIAFGEHRGQDVWQEVPGEYRSDLRRLIVVQGDTEPASVEQQRQLSLTAPSLYDMRNLFQVNVEEGRHLWAMVYLLHRYFGQDGRDEADAMLERHSGDADNPRILGAFNEETPDWLSFFFFTYFTDRDGKYQLASMRESAFDPLSRTCDFMLKEEAHHMFVGATGIGRVVARTLELMQRARHRRRHAARWDQPRRAPEVPQLPLLGVARPVRRRDVDERRELLLGRSQGPLPRGAARRRPPTRRPVPRTCRRRPTPASVSARSRSSPRSTRRCARTTPSTARRASTGGTGRSPRPGSDVELRLPHVGFHRQVGTFAGHHVSPDGRVIDDAEWSRQRRSTGCPTDDDKAHVKSLMVGVTEPGKMAGWIAPPSTGINQKPVDYEYVQV